MNTKQTLVTTLVACVTLASLLHHFQNTFGEEEQVTSPKAYKAKLELLKEEELKVMVPAKDCHKRLSKNKRSIFAFVQK